MWVPVPDAPGVYAIEYTAGNVAGTDVISFREDKSEETATIALNVSEPQIIVRTLQDDCSIFSTCSMVIQLKDSVGASMTNAVDDDTLEVFSSNINYAKVNQDSLQEIGEDSGVYYVEFDTFNHAEYVDIQIRLSAGNTVNKSVNYKIEDYVITVRPYGETMKYI